MFPICMVLRSNIEELYSVIMARISVPTSIRYKVDSSHRNIPLLPKFIKRHVVFCLAIYLLWSKFTHASSITYGARCNSIDSDIIISTPLQCQVSCYGINGCLNVREKL